MVFGGGRGQKILSESAHAHSAGCATGSLEPKLGQARMIVGAPTQRPVELALGGR